MPVEVAAVVASFPIHRQGSSKHGNSHQPKAETAAKSSNSSNG